MPFYDRTRELAALHRANEFPTGGQMAVVLGRRRVGKTFLLQRFCQSKIPSIRYRYFLAEQTTADVQRQRFAEALIEGQLTPEVSVADIASSWNTLLRFLMEIAGDGMDGRLVAILDEFPYLVEQSPELPSTLQSWWDRSGSRSSVFLILCGSQLSVMDALGSPSAPLYGRFNAGIMRVLPMTYRDVASFYRGSKLYKAKDALTMYGVFGGSPRYHSLVDTSKPLSDQIVSLILASGSPLENEVRYLLSSEQVRDPAPYNAVLEAIARGRTQFGEIAQAATMDSPTLSRALRILTELEWVLKESPFGEASGRRALYRIADPFVLFWYRFVAPLASALQFADPSHIFATRIEPLLSDYMRWNIFERVCMQWLQSEALGTLGLSIQSAGRYWSRDGRTEIDIVAECADGTKLFCECKWSISKPRGIQDYFDLRSKVARLPNNEWAEGAHYALFSMGGFTSELRALAISDGHLSLISGDEILPWN